MNFLIIAEKYAQAHDDETEFKNLYTDFREYNSVNDSVWKTLSYLYGNRVANMLSEFKL
jgi:predicted RNA-binding protein associated with RNAse of E/G family